MVWDLPKFFINFSQGSSSILHGAKDYWSTRNLMQGYAEAAHEATQLVNESTGDSNPLARAGAGSAMAVGKMLGAIPIGINHWVIETARSTLHQGAGAGFKTLIGTPIEGFIDGGKFILNQIKNWSHGKIAENRMAMADEVTTTLGTAGLMSLGIQTIHGGGLAVMQGLKGINLPSPSLALATGQTIPAASSSVEMGGLGPLAKGLVFMASKKDPPGEDSSSLESLPEQKKITVEGLKKALEEAERAELTGTGEPDGFLRLVEMELRERGEDLALRAVSDNDAMNQLIAILRENTNIDLYVGVIRAARKEPNVLGVLKALERKKVDGAEQTLQVLSEEYYFSEQTSKKGSDLH